MKKEEVSIRKRINELLELRSQADVVSEYCAEINALCERYREITRERFFVPSIRAEAARAAIKTYQDAFELKADALKQIKTIVDKSVKSNGFVEYMMRSVELNLRKKPSKDPQ